MSPDGKVNKEDEMNNANVICIDSAPVIRYCDDTTTYLADIFGNKYVVSGYNLINLTVARHLIYATATVLHGKF